MDIVEKMAEKFDEERLTLKVAEELAELSEVLIKRVTRTKELKPPIEKLIEELGDVFFRSHCLIAKLGIHEKVEDRIRQKSIQVEKWYFENQNL
jgi:NTP pyrophosphatase (non-canonical NTP hydrolase)